ncbi:MAG: hypothetical protein C4532_02255 [Candidatus Abyssobacteria bacterium SURF_17]|uniref:Uncharacterized protein n=1 Tax=Candidatus Abyssobacteria bacterium SURF_17 TaxID=2093361 RepID=A0A419F7X3_9BACT|nr:MAG: hypothetical protein C4532_02255 [Candidatus Abyssubacteria bacterium SURF_17]
MRILEKTLRSLDAHEKTIFWVFVVYVLILPPGPWLHEKYGGIDAEGFPRQWDVAIFFGILVLGIVVGTIVWHALQKEKLRAIKNVVVGLQGFVLFTKLTLIVLGGIMTGFGVLSSELEEHTWNFFPKGALTAVAWFIILLIPLGVFVGGCWVGFKNSRLVFLWCIVGTTICYYDLVQKMLPLDFEGGIHLVIIVGASILGGYLGDRCSQRAPVEPVPSNP